MGTDKGPDRLSTLLLLRSKTDIRVDPKWILPALASYILWIVYAIIYFTGFTLPILSNSQTLGLFGTLAFVASTGLSFLVYRLTSRANKHAEREQEIARELLSKVQSRTSPDQMSILLPLSSAEQDFSGLLQKTHRLSAILWSLLVLVPYAGWVCLIAALYLLTQSSNNHERMETLLFEDLDRTLAAEGFPHVFVTSRSRSQRNSLAFALASVATIGIVAFSWLYVMIIGEQAHFAYHSSLEPELSRIVSTSEITRRST